MTTYQGGKKRIGKRIANVMKRVEDELIDHPMPYLEPFCGMCSVLRHFSFKGDRDVYASDIHPDLILMWKAVQEGWKPPRKCSKKEYSRLKTSPSSPKRSFVGFAASFGGNFFSGGFRIKKGGSDFLGQAYRGLMKTAKDVKNVTFQGPCSYDDYEPEGMLIYCDPPYKGNKLGSDLFRKFDHDAFWDTMRKWSKNNMVFISEWTAPRDFVKIWCTESMNATSSATIRYDDCLYVYKELASFLPRKLRTELMTY
jgi:DNA adenine methylase